MEQSVFQVPCFILFDFSLLVQSGFCQALGGGDHVLHKVNRATIVALEKEIAFLWKTRDRKIITHLFISLVK